MHLRWLVTAVFLLPQLLSAADPKTKLRIMAANITSGSQQSYDPGHGTRIFQGLSPDVVLIQEFNVGNNTPTALRTWVTSTFDATFHFYREANAQIPNGVISRYPIRASGEWDDPEVDNRDFAWARIDLPGSKDLWAISVHFLTKGATDRKAQATSLIRFIQTHVPPADYLVIGGDFNTDSRTEAALSTLSTLVVTAGPYPVDQRKNSHTNAGRAKPYDWVLVDRDLHPHRVPTTIGAQTFAHGLVFDSRVFTPLHAVAPVQPADSGALNMQHMAVVRDFEVPDPSVSSGR